MTEIQPISQYQRKVTLTDDVTGATKTVIYGDSVSERIVRIMAPGIAGKSERKQKTKREMTEWETEMVEVKRGLAEMRRVT